MTSVVDYIIVVTVSSIVTLVINTSPHVDAEFADDELHPPGSVL